MVNADTIEIGQTISKHCMRCECLLLLLLCAVGVAVFFCSDCLRRRTDRPRFTREIHGAFASLV